MELLDRVRATIRRHALTGVESRVVVALSGGADSVALAHVLLALDRAHETHLVGLAHFDHGLRDESAQDASFCREVAEAIGVPIVVASDNVRERARRERRSIEAAAHAARYAFLARAASDLSADRIALGHTRDDQAETFILRLLRGAGPRGLAGMYPKHGPHIRPLIDCRRADVRAYLHAAGQSHLSDPTNDDVRIPRNRIRAELIPLLEARFNPRIVDVLADEADIAREEWQWLAGEAQKLIDAARMRREADGWLLDAAPFARAPTAVARAALLAVLERAAPARSIERRHVVAALAIVRAGEGAIDLPGQRLQRFGQGIVLRERAVGTGRGEGSRRQPEPYTYPLPIPGEVRVTEAACTISAQPHPSGAEGAAVFCDRHTTMVPLDRGIRQLAVRNRRPGDRFQPLGFHGHKKLQDFFVDLKVPRIRRDQVPLVVDQDDRIVWVAGYAVAADFRVTGAAQAVIILRLSLWGDAA